MKGVESQYFQDRKIFNQSLDPETLKLFSNNEGILVGEKLRKKLNIKVGDRLNILSPDNVETILGNFPRSASFKIIGFFSIGMYEYDSSLIYFPIELMKKFLNSKNEIDFLELYVDDFDRISFIKRKLKA